MTQQDFQMLAWQVGGMIAKEVTVQTIIITIFLALILWRVW